MDSLSLYAIAADALLVIHTLFVVFMVLGLALILLGARLCWRWVRNPWLRLVHLIGIGVVVLQSWLGLLCPLTRWEASLRAKAGEAPYQEAFITHWLNELLYYQAPPWVFILCYTLFGTLVLASWFRVRPRPF